MRKPLEVKADVTALLLTAGYRVIGLAIGPSSVGVTISLEDSDAEKTHNEAKKQQWRTTLLAKRAARAERAADLLREAGLPVTMQYRERVAITEPGEFLLSLQDEQMDGVFPEDAPLRVAAGGLE